MREPGASPGRSRRCEGRCPPPRRHWALPAEAGRGREGGGGGAPSQKTCRPPTIEPLAEGGFVVKHLLATLLAALAVGIAASAVSAHVHGTAAAAPQRIISLSPTATETLFAIGAGKQVIAVDDQSDYPKSAPKTSLSGFTPNVEAVVGLSPRPRRHLVLAEGLRRSARQGAHPRAPAGAGATRSRTRTRRCTQLGRVTGHLAEATALVSRMKARIAKLVKGGAQEGAVRLRRAQPRLLLGHVRVDHRPGPQALRPEEHRGRRARRRIGRRRSALRRVHRRVEPRPDRPRRHALLRAEPVEGVAAGRAGGRSRR